MSLSGSWASSRFKAKLARIPQAFGRRLRAVVFFGMKHLSAKSVFAPPLLFFAAAFLAPAQEALKSTEEEYYDFLSLSGETRRPYLNYRTLSDSRWVAPSASEGAEDGKPSHPLERKNLGTEFALWKSKSEKDNGYLRGIRRGIFLRAYGPEWYNSFNTASPYGQNDGGLWQGKGYNTSLTAGARLEGYGLEITVKPQLNFSQNMDFDCIKPNYPAVDSKGNATSFSGLASDYGYYGIASVDAPQRFGDSAFWSFDWGDMEVRYTWRNLTVGFGTENIWLGPARINPILHSNNAAGYPKFDIGLRRSKVFFPHFHWYLGDFEWRSWWGQTKESDWFDNDSSNDKNLVSGFSISWSFPGIFEGLTLGFHRTMLSKWSDIDAYSLFEIYTPFNQKGGADESDQRFSVTADWEFSKIGLEIYFEWGRNDYSPNRDYIMRYPFHTQGWTAGARKSFKFSSAVRGELSLEVSFLESSRDYEMLWSTTFYAHHKVTQGYTNEGQWLGAGMGTGGNSQYLGFKVYWPRGLFSIFIQRRNPDLDYTWYIDQKNSGKNAEKNIRADFDAGLGAEFFFTKSFLGKLNFIFSDEFNPTNDNSKIENRYNFVAQLGLKYEI